jgi:hypothetical protein
MTSGGGVKLQKVVNSLAGLEKIDETLERDSSTPEAWRSTHALRTYPNCFVKSTFLLCGHNPNVSHLDGGPQG